MSNWQAPPTGTRAQLFWHFQKVILVHCLFLPNFWDNGRAPTVHIHASLFRKLWTFEYRLTFLRPKKWITDELSYWMLNMIHISTWENKGEAWELVKPIKSANQIGVAWELSALLWGLCVYAHVRCLKVSLQPLLIDHKRLFSVSRDRWALLICTSS